MKTQILIPALLLALAGLVTAQTPTLLPVPPKPSFAPARPARTPVSPADALTTPAGLPIGSTNVTATNAPAPTAGFTPVPVGTVPAATSQTPTPIPAAPRPVPTTTTPPPALPPLPVPELAPPATAPKTAVPPAPAVTAPVTTPIPTRTPAPPVTTPAVTTTPAATTVVTPQAAVPNQPVAAQVARPGGVATPAVPAGTNTVKAITDPTKIILAGTLKINMPIDQMFDEIYTKLTGRTIIRAPGVPGGTLITLKSETDLTVAEAIQAIDSLLVLNSITMIPVGEKFITAIPSNLALTEAAAFTKKGADDLPEAGQYVTKILQLTHAKPTEIQPIIQGFAKVQGGIMAIDSTQILVIRDYAVNIKRMLEIIEKIDIAVPLEENMEVIPIKYARASEISSVLGSLTSGGAVAGTGGARTTGSGRSTGGRRAGTGTSGTGTTIPGVQPQGGIPGQAQAYNPGAVGATPGAQANAFQQQLQRIVGNAANNLGGAPLLGAARIIPYERNNVLLIIGTRQEISMATNLIEKLDRVQPQVLIEAIIMEVSLDGGLKTGVSIAQSSKSFNSTITGRGASRNGIFGSSLTNAANSALPDGFSYFANIGSAWEVALTAIETDSTINVLSRPRIQTSHAETATLFIGDTVPYVTGTYFGGVNGQASSQYQQREIGITLSVLPIINEDGLVVMDIVQNIEQLGTTIKIDNNDVPQTTKRNAQSKVAVKNGETIILGGFISSQKSKSRSGVPVLRDIPGFGRLFRSDSETTKRVELIVLLRPTVLRDPHDAALTATQERDKLAGVKRAEMEILEEEKKLEKKNLDAIMEKSRKPGTR